MTSAELRLGPKEAIFHFASTSVEVFHHNSCRRDPADGDKVPHPHHHREPVNIKTSSSVRFDDRLDISKCFAFVSPPELQTACLKAHLCENPEMGQKLHNSPLFSPPYTHNIVLFILS